MLRARGSDTHMPGYRNLKTTLQRELRGTTGAQRRGIAATDAGKPRAGHVAHSIAEVLDVTCARILFK
eukprot:3427206-Alexandrium_andersonii.AAC.1